MKSIGITGAGGCIGALLANNLVADHKLRLFTYTGGNPKLMQLEKERLEPIEDSPNCEIVREVDLSDRAAIKGKFQGLDIIIHLAANGSPFQSWDEVKKSNFDVTHHVYEECVFSKVRRIIFASSNHTQHALTAGENAETLDPSKFKTPMKITDAPYPDSLYAISKLFGEDLGKYHAWKDGLEVICFRIGWIKDFEKDDPRDIFDNVGAANYMRAIYLSHQDCLGFYRAAISVDIKSEHKEIPFITVYVCSDNERKIWDMEDSLKTIGYRPVDNVEKFFAK